MATEKSNIRLEALKKLEERMDKRSRPINDFSKIMMKKAYVNGCMVPDKNYADSANTGDYASAFINSALRELSPKIIERAIQLEHAAYQQALADAKEETVTLLTDVVTLQNYAE